MSEKDDFEVILTDSGVSVTWYVNTEVEDAQTGNTIPSYDSGTSITVAISRIDRSKSIFPEGFRDGEAFTMYSSVDNAITKLDKITFDSVDYIVHEKLHTGHRKDVKIYDKYLLRKIGAEA